MKIQALMSLEESEFNFLHITLTNIDITKSVFSYIFKIIYIQFI